MNTNPAYWNRILENEGLGVIKAKGSAPRSKRKPFRAKFPGVCAQCGVGFDEGAAIVYPQGGGKVVHGHGCPKKKKRRSD